MQTRENTQHWKQRHLDLSPILYKAPASPYTALFHCEEQEHGLADILDWQLLKAASPALVHREKVTEFYALRNTNRATGTLLSNELTKIYRAEGLPEDTIHFRFRGTAGQSFGAFSARGITLELEGDANDYCDLVERITVLGDANVGINEVMPFATLHVSRPTSDPASAIALAENTGILCLGQIEDNVVADYRGIQARHGEYAGGGPTLNFTVSDLNLQRLGAGILIHGDDAVDHQVSITGDGKVGIGKTATEKLEINGAVVVWNTDNVAPANGTIRWNSASEDLEGFVGTAWTSLTSGGWEKVDNTAYFVFLPYFCR